MLFLIFAPSLCTLHPGLCTLHFYQRMQVLQLHTWWWSLDATCAGGIFPSAISANTPCTGSGGCSCMLLLHPVLTSTDAAPDLCTLCPDHWALCLWCFPFSTGANFPLAQVVVSPSATGTNTALALRQLALCDGQWWPW